MNDFDRFLELKLRQMLDPVVAAPPPARRRAKRLPKRILAIESAPVVVEALPRAVPLAVPVARATQL